MDNKQNAVCLYNTALQLNSKKKYTIRGISLDKPLKCYAKWTMPYTREYIANDSICVKFSKSW